MAKNKNQIKIALLLNTWWICLYEIIVYLILKNIHDIFWKNNGWSFFTPGDFLGINYISVIVKYFLAFLVLIIVSIICLFSAAKLNKEVIKDNKIKFNIGINCFIFTIIYIIFSLIGYHNISQISLLTTIGGIVGIISGILEIAIVSKYNGSRDNDSVSNFSDNNNAIKKDIAFYTCFLFIFQLLLWIFLILLLKVPLNMFDLSAIIISSMWTLTAYVIGGLLASVSVIYFFILTITINNKLKHNMIIKEPKCNMNFIFYIGLIITSLGYYNNWVFCLLLLFALIGIIFENKYIKKILEYNESISKNNIDEQK